LIGMADRDQRDGDDIPDEPWHGQEVETVLRGLSAQPEGLTGADARQRLQRYGPNEIQRQQGPSWVTVLLRQFRSPLIYALGISAAVALALGEVADGAVVLAVVVLNALIGFAQEYRAGRAIQALAHLVSEPATARRGGTWTQVPAEQLVPGDVVGVAKNGSSRNVG
jgi:magnesium-transporting ATPase (P-type)